LPVLRAARLRPRGRAACALALGLALAAPAAGDEVHLKDGDRISGKVVSQTGNVVRVQTPYGRLNIPKDKVEKIVRGGKAETVSSSPAAPASAGWREHLSRVIVVVTGKAFWHAWEGKGEGDPTLRMEIRIDEDVVAAYLDPKPDPKEIPRAVVNTFSFLKEDVVVQPGTGAAAALPEARTGRIVLRVDVPPAPRPNRRLRVAYQINEGTPAQPAWKDLVDASYDLTMATDGPTFVQMRQDRGSMEFAGFPKRRMRGVETFQIDLSPE
jgi:RNase P/RNase MRP subunit p29